MHLFALALKPFRREEHIMIVTKNLMANNRRILLMKLLLTKMIMLALSGLFLLTVSGCSKDEKKELWIYTSIYKEVIDHFKPILAEKFPHVEIKWFQSGSEKIAAKMNAEASAGQIKADIIMTSDPFWYEQLKQKGLLLQYKSKNASYVQNNFKDPENFYSTVRICAMVMAYNKEALKKNEVPQSFSELTHKRWENKIALGSPLESGTNFTTVSTLSGKYGWDYYKNLRKLNTFSAGGNSTVRRKLESKEYKVGVILLENLLKAKQGKTQLEIIYPQDGTVLIPSPIAIMKRTKQPEVAKKLYDYFLSKEGQEIMTKGFMYSLHPEVRAPTGAMAFKQILPKAFPWDHKFVQKVLAQGEKIKEQYSKIMFE